MSEQVYWILEGTVSDLDSWKALLEEMVAATRNEPGALNYEWTVGADGATCHLFERYADSDAAMVHLGNFGKNFARRFTSLLKTTRFTVYGSPNEAVKKALGPMGVTFMTPIGGFSR